MKLLNLLLRHITPYYYITYCLTSALIVYGTKRRVKLDGSCLKPDIITYTHGNAVNIYIFYELVGHGSYTDDSALKNSFFGPVRLTKNADIDRYGYSCYGTGFDRISRFSFRRGGFGQSVKFL